MTTDGEIPKERDYSAALAADLRFRATEIFLGSLGTSDTCNDGRRSGWRNPAPRRVLGPDRDPQFTGSLMFSDRGATLAAVIIAYTDGQPYEVQVARSMAPVYSGAFLGTFDIPGDSGVVRVDFSDDDSGKRVATVCASDGNEILRINISQMFEEQGIEPEGVWLRRLQASLGGAANAPQGQDL